MLHRSVMYLNIHTVFTSHHWIISDQAAAFIAEKRDYMNLKCLCVYHLNRILILSITSLFFLLLSFADVVSATWRSSTSQQGSITSSPPPSSPNRKDLSSWTFPAHHPLRFRSSNEDGALIPRGRYFNMDGVVEYSETAVWMWWGVIASLKPPPPKSPQCDCCSTFSAFYFARTWIKKYYLAYCESKHYWKNNEERLRCGITLRYRGFMGEI